MYDKIFLTFLNDVTGEDIHNCIIETDVSTIYDIYAKGKFVEIKGTNYQITDIMPCINGTVKFKIKVR